MSGLTPSAVQQLGSCHGRKVTTSQLRNNKRSKIKKNSLAHPAKIPVRPCILCLSMSLPEEDPVQVSLMQSTEDLDSRRI